MKPARILLKAIVVGTAMRVSSGINATCPLGTKVYSLTVWSAWWLDGLVMRCTGEGDENYIPEELKNDPGGEEDQKICAGTAGVQSIHWNLPSAAYGLVYLNITCQDNETYQFADGQAYDFWDVNRNRTISCNEDEYVQGLTYSLEYVENSGYPYFLTDLNFVCSSSALECPNTHRNRTNTGPLCEDCSCDTTLLADGDQPEYCELPSCSEAECCESNSYEETEIADEDTESGNDEAESVTTIVIIVVVSNVAAAMLISGFAWIFTMCRKKHIDGMGIERFRSAKESSVLNGPANSG